jgi:hypothetical protein
MNRSALTILIFTASAFSGAQTKKLADYPLRVHIFRRSETTFYRMRVAEGAKGEGRANLFENGQARGLDFQFNCANQLPTSSGYETFAAKWKKPNQELEVMVPEYGKADKYNKCKFEVQMKDFAYVQHNGTLGVEPMDRFKEWMVKHEYDPEHGKNAPTFTSASGQVAGPPPSTPSR